MPGRPGTMATGLFSGFLNGSAAIGGPPVILFYFSSPAGVTVSRASIIAYFLGTDSLAWLMSLAPGLVSFKTRISTGLLRAPLHIGIHLENRLLIRSKEEAVRRRLLILPMMLSFAALLQTIYG